MDGRGNIIMSGTVRASVSSHERKRRKKTKRKRAGGLAGWREGGREGGRAGWRTGGRAGGRAGGQIRVNRVYLHVYILHVYAWMRTWRVVTR